MLASCLAPTPRVVDLPLGTKPTAYDDLLRYVPADMESVLAFDLTNGHWPAALKQHFGNEACRGVLAGSNFRFAGTFDGVLIVAGSDKYVRPLDDRKSAPAFSVGNVQVRRQSDDELTIFSAKLPSHRIIYATNERLMRHALRRRGTTGHALARSMGWEFINWDCPLILLRCPDPTIASDSPRQGSNRAILWLRHSPDPPAKESKYRVRQFALHVTDAARLKCTARVRTCETFPPKHCDAELELWEMLGGIDLDEPRWSVQGNDIRLQGHLRHALDLHGEMLLLAVFTWFGVRISDL